MKTKSFFVVVIRVFALFGLLASLFNGIPTHVSYLIMVLNGSLVGIYSLLVLFVVIIIFIFISKKAPQLVNALKLEDNLEEDIELNFLKEETIIQVSLIIAGVFLFINNLPEFLNTTFRSFKINVLEGETDFIQHTPWMISFFTTMGGLILIIFNKEIQQLIQRLK